MVRKPTRCWRLTGRTLSATFKSGLRRNCAPTPTATSSTLYTLLPDYQGPTDAYSQALKEIRTFRDAVKAGDADIIAFHQRIAELSAAGSQSGMREREQGILAQVRDDAKDALETAEKLKQLLEGIECIGLKKQREALERLLAGRSDRTDLLRREADVVAQALRSGADREEYKRLSIRIRAEEEARQKIAGFGFSPDSEEADRIRESYRATAEQTIALDRQKNAYERLQEAREGLTGQRDHIARLELETTLIGASNAQRAKAIALLEAEQDIRERKIDPGSKEAEQLRQAAARRAASEARLEEARIAQTLSRSHDEDMQRLRLEAMLIGQSNSVRDRAIALLEAEQEIRRRGIDVNGRLAETIRDNARALAEERSELERQRRAWGELERAGTSAIDRITDGIAEGDIGGALESVAKDLTKSVLRLSTANPLKNALYGTNLPTLSDTGGIGGFFAALLGGGPEALRAANMNVRAATVILNGGTLASPFGAGFGSGAFPPAPGAASLLGGGSVASQAWDFFSGKGLKDFQVAAILGHIKAESGFNPLAVGDGGHSFGLFQHHRGRASGLLDFLGGRGNLGNVGGQLNYAWKELMTSEGRALRNLLASTNLRGATAAFGGFERPAGFSLSNPEAMHNWTGRLQFAGEALRDFGNRTSNATGNLGRFGDGLGSAVTSLAQGSNSLAGTASDFAGQSKGLLGQLTGGLRNLFSRLENAGGGTFGAGGNWLASLFGGSQLGIALSGGVGLYNTGGFTGGGDPAQPAGIVHAQEFVFDAPAVRRLGVPFLEALRSGEAATVILNGSAVGSPFGGGFGAPFGTGAFPPAPAPVTSLSQGSTSLAGTASEFAGQSKGLLGQLFGGGVGGQLGIALSGGVGLYNTGGFTGGGDPAQPAGIVHAQEFVFDAPAVRRLGVPFLEALRSGEAPGYRDGGVVAATPLPFPAGGFSRRSGHGVANGGFPAGLAAGGNAGNGFANPANGIGEITIRLIDADGNEVETRRSRTPDGLQLELLVDQANGRLITRRGSRTRNALEAFDARNKVGSR